MQLRTLILVACLTTVPSVAADGPVPFCDVDETTPGVDCMIRPGAPVSDHFNHDDCPRVHVATAIENAPNALSMASVDPHLECITP